MCTPDDGRKVTKIANNGLWQIDLTIFLTFFEKDKMIWCEVLMWKSTIDRP